jgi:hypothetical protein
MYKNVRTNSFYLRAGQFISGLTLFVNAFAGLQYSRDVTEMELWCIRKSSEVKRGDLSSTEAI